MTVKAIKDYPDRVLGREVKAGETLTVDTPRAAVLIKAGVAVEAEIVTREDVDKIMALLLDIKAALPAKRGRPPTTDADGESQ